MLIYHAEPTAHLPSNLTPPVVLEAAEDKSGPREVDVGYLLRYIYRKPSVKQALKISQAGRHLVSQRNTLFCRVDGPHDLLWSP